jgi:hypothetical protein
LLSPPAPRAPAPKKSHRGFAGAARSAFTRWNIFDEGCIDESYMFTDGSNMGELERAKWKELRADGNRFVWTDSISVTCAGD